MTAETVQIHGPADEVYFQGQVLLTLLGSPQKLSISVGIAQIEQLERSYRWAIQFLLGSAFDDEVRAAL
eukprot:1151475-Pelagomonas_calceolata.AAC.3